MAKVIDILASITDIWIWIGAGYIGLSFGLITRKRKQEKENHREPIKGNLGIEFFNSREELRKKYPLENLLSQAKHRIVILGGSLEYIAIQNRNTIRNILERGINIEFLLQNPDWVSSARLSEEIAFPTT